MRSRYPSNFAPRYFYLVACCIVMLIVHAIGQAQRAASSTESSSAGAVAASQVPTPPPIWVCVTDPCYPTIPLPNPVPSVSPLPKEICLPGEPIDSCTTDPVTGRCITIQKPCVTPSPPPTTPGQTVGSLIISEFRFRGPGGTSDEFVELFNPSSSPITVNTADGSAGWALVASDGVVRFTVPVNTVIPGYGHYLAVNSVGYSLGGYPAGATTTATGDTVYILDIPDRSGIALFNTSEPTGFTLANRMDAVGYNLAPALYREGAGFPTGNAETFLNIEYSFYRELITGFPQDTNDNTADFRGVDTTAANTGAGQRLGAPGPENLSSPVAVGQDKIQTSLLDPTIPREDPPNRVRDYTSDPENNSTYGTLSIRRRFTNVSSANITRLRFRIIDITNYPTPDGTSDIRAINSGDTKIDPNAEVTTENDVVHGTRVEVPPMQINGGGWNSTMTSDMITPSTPLLPGQSINLQFLVGIQKTGYFRFFIVIEAK
jgi:hypothetical protein